MYFLGLSFFLHVALAQVGNIDFQENARHFKYLPLVIDQVNHISLRQITGYGCSTNNSINTNHERELNIRANYLIKRASDLESENRDYQAVLLYRKALRIHLCLQDQLNVSRTYNLLGNTLYNLGRYAEAEEASREAFRVARIIRNRNYEGQALNNLGRIAASRGYYLDAVTFHEQAANIAFQIKKLNAQGAELYNIGAIYYTLSEYSQALNFYAQSLQVRQEANDYSGQGRTLHAIGLAYLELGKAHQAKILLYQALSILEESGDLRGTGYVFHALASYSIQMEQYPEAIAAYQKAIELFREAGLPLYEGQTLSSVGEAYFLSKNFAQAVDSLTQALTIAQQIGDRPSEGETLDRLGQVYAAQGDYEQAFGLYQQALEIIVDIGDRDTERLIYSHIGDLLVEQEQPELAIVFYKKSVNVTESIRDDIRELPTDLQISYTNTIADTYRTLADLLLQQDRVLEALQVLDLLKVQEIEDYLRRVRGNEQTAQGIELLSDEQEIEANYIDLIENAIARGRQRLALEVIPRNERTPEQEQQLLELRAEDQTLQSRFQEFIMSPTVQAIVDDLRVTSVGQTVDPTYLRNWQERLEDIQQDAVLLYPFVQDDRLYLLLATPYSPPIYREVQVSRIELNTAISEFLSALKDPEADATVSAQRLYRWLIEPIEPFLTEANAQTILYAPDGQLRYVPLAALYDGDQWLVERYRINNITAVSLYDLTAQPQTQPQILAGAFSSGRFNIQIGTRSPIGLSGLPFTEVEVESIASFFPDTLQLVNQDLTRDATLPYLNDYNVVHLATHAVFVAGQPEDSFILMGNGDQITIADISTIDLSNVDLVVLSACQTGLGAMEDGREILGFGYQVQAAQAAAAIASLWQVDDGGTQLLMAEFYRQLLREGMTKAEALQQAQIALIRGEITPSTQIASDRGMEELLTLIDNQGYRHPYYWAPFILIGNGL